jgi:hypothetical protein
MFFVSASVGSRSMNFVSNASCKDSLKPSIGEKDIALRG